MHRMFFVLMILGMLAVPRPAEALIVINEILADPASGTAGDANGDGVRSGTDDEFIELFNQADAGIDLSGWYITDVVSTKHIFPAGTILGGQEILVIFGGGNPAIPEGWQTASSGGLSLNNSGDTVSLFNADNLLINQVIYGSEAGNDQSISRSPEGFGSSFVLHTTLDDGQLFSPGYFVQTPQAAVPEPVSAVLFSAGLIGMAGLKRRSH